MARLNAKVLFLCFGASLLMRFSYAAPVLETEGFVFSLGGYFRTDVISLKNTVDLDSANSDDTSTYLGIDYNLDFKYASKTGGPQFYLKLERNGPGDYDAPLFIHNTLINNGGRIERYRNEELLPQVEEFWWDQPLWGNFGFKAGLYTYDVGHGVSLNGCSENYGLTFYRQAQNIAWRFYYCRPEIVYKNRLGPRIHQEIDQGYFYHHNASNFFATDIKFSSGTNYLQPYVGMLADYSSPGKRDNIFTAPIKRDLLGTLGAACNLERDKLSLKAELARNFGRAKSSDENYKDIEHTGYLAYAELGYRIAAITPVISGLFCSGNKVTPDMALNQDETLTLSRNRAFSAYSPTNRNLGGSISSANCAARPIVAMGSGCGLHDGILRPRSLAVSDFENLFLPSAGIKWDLTGKLSMELYWYYLMSAEKGVGTLDGEGKYLSRDLGREIDLFLDYKISPQVSLSFLGGYFFPGRYYKTKRDDASGSILSPFIRGDGDADPAYQVEFSLELKF